MSFQDQPCVVGGMRQDEGEDLTQEIQNELRSLFPLERKSDYDIFTKPTFKIPRTKQEVEEIEKKTPLFKGLSRESKGEDRVEYLQNVIKLIFERYPEMKTSFDTPLLENIHEDEKKKVLEFLESRMKSLEEACFEKDYLKEAEKFGFSKEDINSFENTKVELPERPKERIDWDGISNRETSRIKKLLEESRMNREKTKNSDRIKLLEELLASLKEDIEKEK